MFTVKLYRENRTRIVRADSLTVIGGDYFKEITLHRSSGEHDDEVFYVGTPQAGTHDYADQHRIYDRAIVENANGKTTDFIAPPMSNAPPARASAA